MKYGEHEHFLILILETNFTVEWCFTYKITKKIRKQNEKMENIFLYLCWFCEQTEDVSDIPPNELGIWIDLCGEEHSSSPDSSLLRSFWRLSSAEGISNIISSWMSSRSPLFLPMKLIWKRSLFWKRYLEY